MVAPAMEAREPLTWNEVRDAVARPATLGLVIATTLAFVGLFSEPVRTLARDWWNNPDAGHGLLLAPVSLWLGWKAGLSPLRQSQPVLGSLVLVGAVLLRWSAGLAAELFTMRFSAWLAIVGVIVFFGGLRQLRQWWLPVTLMLLSIPLPAVITNTLAIPLQLKASQLGTALIEWREIPVRLSGNVIQIPGQRLFVAEACSGLRSLTALIALGVMMGGIYLRTWPARIILILLSIPIAVAVNSVRIFLTAFLMHFVDPALGRGFMHTSEGWALFVGALGLVGLLAWAMSLVERRILGRNEAAT